MPPTSDAASTFPRTPGLLSADWRPWLPVLAGLLILYVPTYVDLARYFWQYERGSHGPIILGISLWLIWRQRAYLAATRPDTPLPILGWGLFGVGLACYALGRSQDFFQFEAGSQLLVLTGLVLALRGKEAFARLWFPIFFLLFVIPVPGSLLDAVLLPLKQLVSVVVEQILYWLGYPIARTGVVLQIGPYQLLIADACSGLNSMVALSGIGLLFVYLAAPKNRLHGIILLAAILPIAFIANIARVLILMLVTYYYGDGAGQAFHDQAGYLEIVFAFGAFFGFDWVLGKILGTYRRPPAPA
jgi:exosortase B